MAITLPTQSQANTDSLAAQATATADAQAAFIANTTVLINNAITLGQFFVQPFIVPLVTSTYITTYFQALSYTVVFPITPPGPWDPCFAPAGFPEVLGPDWCNWSCCCGSNCTPRIQISWGP